MNLVKIGESEHRKRREVLGLASCHFCNRYVWLIRPDISTNLDPLRWVTSQGCG